MTGTYRPSIAERITWTSRQLSSSEVKVLSALLSCGDYGTGRNCHASRATLAQRAGVSVGTVMRSLRRLKDPAQTGGAWIVGVYRHRQPTRYDLVLDRLAASPPSAQQMALDVAQGEPAVLKLEDQIDPLDLLNPVEKAGLEDHFDPQEKLADQIDPLKAGTPGLEDQNDPPPLYVRTDQEDPDPARAKLEDQNDPQETDGALPLVGRPAPPRCVHPNAHGWCEGRVHVPRNLHFEFLERLDTRRGEGPAGKLARLTAFYVATLAAIPDTQPIGASAYTFWLKAFERFVADAETVRRARGTTTHERVDDAQAVVATAVAHREQAAQREQEDRQAAARAAIERLDPAAYAALKAEAEPDLVAYRYRMTPEVYVDTVLKAMVQRLLTRWRDEAGARRREA